MNILIVEDCPVMRLVIKRALGLMGFYIGSVFEAANGKEGLELLDREIIHLVIIDITMPVMDGVEMLEEIRKKPVLSSVPILTVSTETNQNRITFIENLSSELIHKPFTLELLKEKVLKLLPNIAIIYGEHSIYKSYRQN